MFSYLFEPVNELTLIYNRYENIIHITEANGDRSYRAFNIKNNTKSDVSCIR